MSIAPATQPFRFMDLPAEMRVEIYKSLVVVGKVSYTPDWYELENSARFKDLDTTPVPSLTILRVSKVVHEEAEDVYLTQNIFVLPLCWGDMHPFEAKPESSRAARKRHSFSSNAFAKLRHVSIAYCIRSSKTSLVKSNSSWAEEGVKSFGEVDTINEAHVWAHHFMCNTRRIARNDLKEFKALPVSRDRLHQRVLSSWVMSIPRDEVGLPSTARQNHPYGRSAVGREGSNRGKSGRNSL